MKIHVGDLGRAVRLPRFPRALKLLKNHQAPQATTTVHPAVRTIRSQKRKKI